MCVDLEESDVVDGKCDEQKQSENMRPYVDLIMETKILIAAYKVHCEAYSFVGPPENRFPAELRRQHCAISFANEWVELQICWCLLRK